MQFIAGPRPRLGRRPRGLQQRQVRQVDPRQGLHDDGVPDPRRHPVPLRPRRRLHRLRRLPLLVHRRHRPQPLLHVDRATPATTARAAARSSATTRPATTGRPTPSAWRRPGSPGRSTRTSATASTRTAAGAGSTDAYRGNYGDNSLLYFNQYRNAKPGDPLYDKARTGTDAKARASGYFDQLKADVKAGKLPQISWIAAPEAFTEHPNWPANYGAWYISQVLDALTSDPEVWARRPCSSPTTRTTASSTTSSRRTRRAPPTRASPPSTSALDLFTGNATYAGRPLRPRPARADARRLAVEQGRLRLLRDLRPHLDHPVHGDAASASTSPTSRPGGAPSAAT